jgi:hypothetical protein
VQRPARVGNITLVPVEHTLGLDWETVFGLAPDAYETFTIHQEDEFTEVFVVTGIAGSGPVTLGHVLPRETGEGLALIDDATGDELFFYPRGIEGVQNDMSANLVNGWRSSSLFAITADSAELVDLWQTAPGEPPILWAVEVVEFGDEVIATAIGDGGAESHITSDGLSWQDHPSPPEGAGTTYDEQSGYLYASVFGMFAPTHWISADSVNWTLLEIDSDQHSVLHRLDLGWLILVHDDGGSLSNVAYFAAGGVTSQIEIGLPAGEQIRHAVALNNSVVLVGESSMWLGELSLEQ